MRRQQHEFPVLGTKSNWEAATIKGCMVMEQRAVFLRGGILVLLQGLRNELRGKDTKMDCLQSLKKEFKRMCGMLVMLMRQYSAACSLALSYFIAGPLCEL